MHFPSSRVPHRDLTTPLTDFPRQARWLQKDEIAWLETVQATEKRNKEKVEHLSLFQALTDTGRMEA